MDKQTQQTLANLAVAKQHREAAQKTVDAMRPVILEVPVLFVVDRKSVV